MVSQTTHEMNKIPPTTNMAISDAKDQPPTLCRLGSIPLTVLVATHSGRAERDGGEKKGESETHQEKSEAIQSGPVEADRLPGGSLNDGLISSLSPGVRRCSQRGDTQLLCPAIGNKQDDKRGRDRHRYENRKHAKLRSVVAFSIDRNTYFDLRPISSRPRCKHRSLG